MLRYSLHQHLQHRSSLFKHLMNHSLPNQLYFSRELSILRLTRISAKVHTYRQMSTSLKNTKYPIKFESIQDGHEFCLHLIRHKGPRNTRARLNSLKYILSNTNLPTPLPPSNALTADMIAEACSALSNLPSANTHVQHSILVMSQLISANRNLVFSSLHIDQVTSLLRGKMVKSNDDVVCGFIKTLQKELVEGKHQFTQTDILKLVSHLEWTDYRIQTFRDFLAELIKFYDSAPKEVVRLNVITEAIVALRYLSAGSPEVKKLVLILSEQMSVNNELLNTQGLVDCLVGMQHLVLWDINNVLLREIARHADKNLSSLVFSPSQIVCAMSGFDGRCIHLSDASKKIVSILTNAMTKCTEPFTVTDLCSIIYYLRRSTASSTEIKKLLIVISQKLFSCSKQRMHCDSVDIYKALNGLMCMDMCAEVADIIKALTILMSSADNKYLQLPDVLNGLYGLQRFNSNNIQPLLLLVNSHLSGLQWIRPFRHYARVANALFGLRGMPHASAGTKIKEYFLRNLKSDIEVSKISSFDRDSMQSLVRTILLTIPQSDLSIDMKNSYSQIAETLSTELNLLYHNRIKTTTYYDSELIPVTTQLLEPRSPIESEFYRLLKHFVLQNSRNAQSECYIETNVEILNFECDVVLHIAHASEKSMCIVNFEIDGPSHVSENRILFAKLRDDFLFRELSIVVVRIPAFQVRSMMKNLKDGRFCRRVLSAISSRDHDLCVKVMSARPDLFPSELAREVRNLIW